MCYLSPRSLIKEYFNKDEVSMPICSQVIVMNMFGNSN